MTTTTGSRPLALSWARSLEHSGRLDPWVGRVRPLADRLLADAGRARVLHGVPLGHAIHPLLTDLPLGLWMSSTVLDLLGGPRAAPAADRLLGLGLLAAVPTAAAGLADWGRGDEQVRRVGVVHAALNSAALTLYGVSWVQRKRGARTRGVLTAVVAGVVATGGGYLGGHLTTTMKFPPQELAEPRDAAPDAEPGLLDDL